MYLFEYQEIEYLFVQIKSDTSKWCMKFAHIKMVFRRFEHCDRYHSLKQTLLQLVDARHAMDSLQHRPSIVWLLVRLGILGVFALEYSLNVGNHHGMYRRNASIQSRSKRQLNSKTGICTRDNPCRVLDTSENSTKNAILDIF